MKSISNRSLLLLLLLLSLSSSLKLNGGVLCFLSDLRWSLCTQIENSHVQNVIIIKFTNTYEFLNDDKFKKYHNSLICNVGGKLSLFYFILFFIKIQRMRFAYTNYLKKTLVQQFNMFKETRHIYHHTGADTNDIFQLNY